MSRPRLLDLFCGAGGAAVGYHRAGFDVTGVDNRPMPRYPFAFIQADALEFVAEHGREYDAIHASPPCQRYSRATAWRGDRLGHPDLITATQTLLRAADRPYVIENVQEARGLLRGAHLLCGSSFGLRVRRHRYFELWPQQLLLLPGCQHRASDYSHDHGGKQTEAAYRDALDCSWMTAHEAREAIPPAYTEHIGTQLLAALGYAA